MKSAIFALAIGGRLDLAIGFRLDDGDFRLFDRLVLRVDDDALELSGLGQRRHRRRGKQQHERENRSGAAGA
jgi:hypothetical protein